MNVIFGTKKLGKQDGAAGAYAKYPEQAVVTLEGDRGAGKSRRMFFNAKAAEALGLTTGDVQHIVFGTIDADEEGNRIVLLANASNMSDAEDLTIYKTSKNLVPTETEPKERMKSIQSSVITKEINDFLELDENVIHEYALESFDVDGIGTDTFRLAKIKAFEADLDTNSTQDEIDSAKVSSEVCVGDCEDCDCDADLHGEGHAEFIDSLSSKAPEELVQVEQDQLMTQGEAGN